MTDTGQSRRPRRSEHRSRTMAVRVSNAELERFLAAAEREDRPLSEWVREVLRRAAEEAV